MRSLLRSAILAASALVACWGISGCSDETPSDAGKMAKPTDTMDTGKMSGAMDKMDTGKMGTGKMDTGKMGGDMDKMDSGKMAPEKH